MNNTFKTYTLNGEIDLLPIGYMNYEMIRELFHVYTFEGEDEDNLYAVSALTDYMKNNPSYYGYISIDIYCNDNDTDFYDNTDDYVFGNYHLYIDNVCQYEVCCRKRKVKNLNTIHLGTIENTKINLETLIINRNRNINNKILIKKELQKICKYDAIYEILQFV